MKGLDMFVGTVFQYSVGVIELGMAVRLWIRV